MWPIVRPFQDLPASYVKDIQSSEFFQLSKLLPNNPTTEEERDNLVLTLDDSFVRVSKQSKTTTSITEIEQWTPDSLHHIHEHYHSEISQLLKYMSLIRYAAKVGLYIITNFARKLAKTKPVSGPI